jgi:hypothetical protein
MMAIGWGSRASPPKKSSSLGGFTPQNSVLSQGILPTKSGCSFVKSPGPIPAPKPTATHIAREDTDA